MRAIFATTLFLLGAAVAQAQTDEFVAERGFVTKAALDNMLEMGAAKLAITRSQNDGLKTVAQQLAVDHMKAVESLQLAARQIGVATPPHLDDAHQTALERLGNAPAGQFDQTFKAESLKAHAEMAAMLSSYVESGAAPALKSWAQEMLPTVQKHKAALDAL